MFRGDSDQLFRPAAGLAAKATHLVRVRRGEVPCDVTDQLQIWTNRAKLDSPLGGDPPDYSGKGIDYTS